MILGNGKPLFMTSLDSEAITNMIELMDYNRVFIHTRYATQGKSALQNCHGWNSGSTYVFHNGSIRSKIADKFEVDSMAIKYWLDTYGLDETLDRLENEPFANVFLVDLDKSFFVVSRSMTGSLFTDGNGNYSTNSFDNITMPVSQQYFKSHDFDCENTNQISLEKSYIPSWDTYTSSLDDFDTWTKPKYAMGE
jgi:predicted glutamine amidotransferase